MLAGALATGASLSHIHATALAAVRDALERIAERPTLDLERACMLLRAASLDLLAASLPIAGALFVVALAVGSLQTRGLVTLEPVAPKLSKLSPFGGLKRLVGLRAVAELGKVWLRLVAVALCGASAVASHAREAALAVGSGGAAPFALALRIAETTALRAAAALVVVGAADLALQHRLHKRDHRMSKDDVRRDRKEEEGDPQIKSARRAAHEEISAGAMIAATRTATVVVVNPTHLAVALRYDADGDEAPRVVAKGAGRLATRIRRAARDAGIGIVRDRTLARSLHTVPVGAEIPAPLYDAVADLIVRVLSPDGSD
jgi:flagellar biosynthesis protein FlhB